MSKAFVSENANKINAIGIRVEGEVMRTTFAGDNAVIQDPARLIAEEKMTGDSEAPAVIPILTFLLMTVETAYGVIGGIPKSPPHIGKSTGAHETMTILRQTNIDLGGEIVLFQPQDHQVL